ncbi:MAG TPA: BON domain-containing protein [Pyrinomonadaceae bacterium]|nr:BON domain-containing protein [Pyrinomonadaceae bacterium]
MANQESEQRRVVVETPTARREEVHSEAVRYPDRSGVSGAALAAIVVGVVALAAIIILFVLNQQQSAVNDNMAAQQQPPQTIVQQPAQQPPVIVQQPAPATQPAPVIINGQPAPPAGSTTTTSSGPDDFTIQAAIDKKFSDDPKLSALGVTTTVVDGKVTLMGSVHSAADKSLAEKAVRNVKGVKSVDNQISVSG